MLRPYKGMPHADIYLKVDERTSRNAFLRKAHRQECPSKLWASLCHEREPSRTQPGDWRRHSCSQQDLSSLT